jgi:Tol biopolymer transport system component
MRGARGAGWVLLLCCAALPFLSTHARAQSDLRLRWRTLESAHFRLHYHEPLGIWARTLAAEVEAIHDRVGSALGLQLRQRVELVIADESDAANGFANVIPYNAIRLRVAAPDDLSPLADYDAWPSLLLTHEYTHVLHLEQAGLLPRLLQRIFGRIYTPQQFSPGWLVEGLAVQQETQHSTAGRARGTTFDMYLRMDALEDRWIGLDWIGFDGERWPHGNVRYAYGGLFMQFIAERLGPEAFGRFIREYGRRIVPYGLNRALKRTSGETFVALYEAFRQDVRARAEQVRAEVVARNPRSESREGVQLTKHGELTRTPRFVSPHEVVYGVYDNRRVPELRSLDLRTGQARRLARTQTVPQASRAPQSVIFAATDYHRTVYSYSDLFAIVKGRRRKLTHALRAREPDVSPDGKQIAYVVQGAGTAQLEVAELADIEGTRRVVVQSERFEQVFTPRWSPDGTKLAYGSWRQGGYRDLWLLELASGTSTRLTYDRALDRGPVFAPDGARLYFSSDRTGIANLYAYELASGELTQITDVLGGAFQPDVSPDGKSLVYVGYSSRGFDLYRLQLADVRGVPAAVPFDRPPPRTLAEPARLISHAYQPLSTLYPRSWQVTTEDTGRGTRVVVSTDGRDAVGFHGWSLRAGTLLDEHDVTVDAAYAWRQPRFPVLLYASWRDYERHDLHANYRSYPWDARFAALGIASTFTVRWPLRSLSGRLDYATNVLQQRSRFGVPLDPNYPHPREPPLGFDARAYWSATYASAQRQAYDISDSWGSRVMLAGSVADPYLGSRDRSYGLTWRFEQFVRFAARESVLALSYTGAQRSQVALGGYPAQLVPLGDALLGTKLAPSDYARLRGFAPRYGDTLQALQLEYRFLLGRINRGYDTLPLFARRLHAALFGDVGDSWYGGQRELDWRRLGVGLGGELRLDWSARYGVDYTLRAGVARGVTEGGLWQWYTSLAAPY